MGCIHYDYREACNNTTELLIEELEMEVEDREKRPVYL